MTYESAFFFHFVELELSYALEIENRIGKFFEMVVVDKVTRFRVEL